MRPSSHGGSPWVHRAHSYFAKIIHVRNVGESTTKSTLNASMASAHMPPANERTPSLVSMRKSSYVHEWALTVHS